MAGVTWHLGCVRSVSVGLCGSPGVPAMCAAKASRLGEAWLISEMVSAALSCQGPSGSEVVMLRVNLRSRSPRVYCPW